MVHQWFDFLFWGVFLEFEIRSCGLEEAWLVLHHIFGILVSGVLKEQKVSEEEQEKQATSNKRQLVVILAVHCCNVFTTPVWVGYTSAFLLQALEACRDGWNRWLWGILQKRSPQIIWFFLEFERDQIGFCKFFNRAMWYSNIVI